MAETQTQQQGGLAVLSQESLIEEVKRLLDAEEITPPDLGITEGFCGNCGSPLEKDDHEDIDLDELASARSYMVQRNYREVLWCLEKALGPRFSGLSEITPEQLK